MIRECFFIAACLQAGGFPAQLMEDIEISKGCAAADDFRLPHKHLYQR